MCRLIIIIPKTLDETTLLLSLVYGVNAKIMKKFIKVRLNTFFDCRTVRQVFFDKKEAIFF